jgi:hypothetical protein
MYLLSGSGIITLVGRWRKLTLIELSVSLYMPTNKSVSVDKCSESTMPHSSGLQNVLMNDLSLLNLLLLYFYACMLVCHLG